MEKPDKPKLKTKISAMLEGRMTPETKAAREEWIGPPYPRPKSQYPMRHPVPELYVGDIDNAKKVLARPKGSHIKSILSILTDGMPLSRKLPHLIIPVDDDGNLISPNLIDLAIAFIKKAPKPVLVHCYAGANRSTLMAAAYIWSESWNSPTPDGGPGMTVDEAILLCQHKSWNPPAPDIVALLKRWAGELKPTDECEHFKVEKVGIRICCVDCGVVLQTW